jgi:hypothetical protein
MKKTLATLTIIAGLALTSYGQGFIFFDTSNNSVNLVSIDGVVDTTVDINAALINPTISQTVATLLLSDNSAVGDIGFWVSGQLTDQSGLGYYTGTGSPGTAPGGSATFQVEGWLGAYSTYAAAVAANAPHGISTPFTDGVSAFGSPVGALDNFTGLNIVSTPEPSTLALAGIGAAMLIIRRRK